MKKLIAVVLALALMMTAASALADIVIVQNKVEITSQMEEFAKLYEEKTGVPMPENLRGLKERPVLHRDCVAPADMLEYVREKKAESSWAE